MTQKQWGCYECGTRWFGTTPGGPCKWCGAIRVGLVSVAEQVADMKWEEVDWIEVKAVDDVEEDNDDDN